MASATTTDTWDARPAGGAPPPGSFLVMTRGDAVEAIGASTVAAFLSPVDSAPNAAFLAQIATEGVSILVVEQFARVVLGVADRAAIMVHGTIKASGLPEELAGELQLAYLGGGTS